MGRRRTRVEQAGARAAERSNVMESSAVPSALPWSRTVGRRNRDSANVESSAVPSAVPSAVLGTEPSRFRLYTAPGRDALLYPFGRDRDRSRRTSYPAPQRLRAASVGGRTAYLTEHAQYRIRQVASNPAKAERPGRAPETILIPHTGYRVASFAARGSFSFVYLYRSYICICMTS